MAEQGTLLLKPIGFIRSCYKEKFGIPRQSGLVTEARATLHLLPDYAMPTAFTGLAQFSHIWLIFCFHATQNIAWKPTVRPPRLGGNQRLGVFATRSMFRPNPIGLSVARLLDVQFEGTQGVLNLAGIDLLDGTPVLDIKPYISYADAISDASSGFVESTPVNLQQVVFSPKALLQCAEKTSQWQLDIETLLRQILQQDPRPAYRWGSVDKRQYGMKLYDFDVRWCYESNQIEVLELVDIEG